MAGRVSKADREARAAEIRQMRRDQKRKVKRRRAANKRREPETA